MTSKILDERTIAAKYDVLVVGAGLGGMTAASLLAKRGLSVLIIDQQDKPGGSCTSFKREGRLFDVGTAMLYGFGKQGFHPFYFLINQLEENIDVIAHKNLFRMTFEDQEIIFWPDIERFLEELDRLFPEEKVGLRSFYDDLEVMYENIVIKNEMICPPSEMSPKQGLRRLKSDPWSLIKMQKLLSTSTADLMKKYFHTPGIHDFFDKLCSAYAYTTAEETPAVLAATMFVDNHKGGAYYPAGGAQMLPNVLERSLEIHGGETLYKRLVDQILIKDGKTYGVRLSDGIEIYADRIVANTTVWNIYGKLIDQKHIKKDRFDWAMSLIPTFPSMTLYMVIDREALPSDTFSWEIFIENGKVIDSSDLTLYINALVDETVCAPNELVVMAISPNFDQWPSPQDPEYRSEAYEIKKRQNAQKMLDQIEWHIPGFKSSLKELIIGSPTTIERYLLKNGGAVGGPKNQIGQEMLKRLHARSEWKNLYFCGDSTVMGTGAPATVVSGIGAANVILRDMKLADYDIKNFESNFVNYVELPFSYPEFNDGDQLTEQNAFVAASQCQWCEHPRCVPGCPAGVDIPGFLRRMQTKNYIGAAKLIREKTPFGETSGLLCGADQLCQKDCYRKDYSGRSVRIADLQYWVCHHTGEEGWPLVRMSEKKPKVLVIGDDPASYSCAYYLALAGASVIRTGIEDHEGQVFRQRYSNDSKVCEAIERDLEGIKRAGVFYRKHDKEETGLNLSQLCQEYDAIYLSNSALGLLDDLSKDYCDDSTKELAKASPVHLRNLEKVTLGMNHEINGLWFVKGAGYGRRAAQAVWDYLK